MQRKIYLFLLVNIFFQHIYCQGNGDVQHKFSQQYFSLQGGLTLLEVPAVFYPNIGISYSKTILGKSVHQLAVNPQLQFISLPSIENKFLLSANAEYKLQTKWRFEFNVFVGVNYQMRRFAYDVYEFKDSSLQNVGNIKHQIGPAVGIHLGYKILRRKKYSIGPFIGVSLTKLRNSYNNSFKEGFVPTAFFGAKLNFNKYLKYFSYNCNSSFNKLL
jgi:hypothetical protein